MRSFLDVGNIRKAFSGEELHYDIHYWIFQRIARVTLRFEKGEKDGLFLATLVSEISGIMAWLLEYKRYFFRSYMRSEKSGKRLLTYRFEREVRKAGHLFQAIYQIDYGTRMLKYSLLRDGILIRKTSQVIRPGMIVDDILSALYNLRFGVYGPHKKQSHYQIQTFTEKGFPHILVDILDGIEEKQERAFLGGTKEGYIIKVFVPPGEIIPSKKGDISVWATETALPIKGILKDALFFGDVVGDLVDRT